ncbi:MAG: ribosomal-processing cysteine protease Prp [Clostridia bacterium]
MITVTMLCAQEKIEGFICEGHANYDEAGRDIVCSAVSALTQTCILGLTDVIGLHAGVSIDENDGITCVIEKDIAPEQTEKAMLLFQTMAAGLSAIRKAYPKNLKIRNREV